MDKDPFAELLTVAPLNLAQYGFAPAIVVAVSAHGQAGTVWLCREMLRSRGMTYAALRDDGLPLVTGAAPGRLWDRWKAILAVISGETACFVDPRHEPIDPRGWARAVRGRSFQVWARRSLGEGSTGLLEQEATALADLLHPGLGTAASQHAAANLATAPLERRVGA